MKELIICFYITGMELIGKFQLSDQDRYMLWTLIAVYSIGLLSTIVLNYWLKKDKNDTLFLQLKAEVLREQNKRKNE